MFECVLRYSILGDDLMEVFVPKISVLMAVYNTKEEYLQEAIKSILSQSFEDFEFLIIDDCSNVFYIEEIVESFQDPRIKFFRNAKNLGISATRNKLVKLAQGEYLAIMDHDDISLPTRFAMQVEFLDKNPEYGVVSSCYKNIPSQKIAYQPENDEQIKIALMRSCAILHPASMIRKSLLEKNNLSYDEEFSPAEDYALWSKLISYTKFYNFPQILFHYRNYANNTTNVQSERMEKARMNIHAINEIEHPLLYKKFLNNATFTKRIKLFGILPILTIIERSYRTKIYLFEKVLIFSYKLQMKLKG